jgi:hypothetical protein
LGYTSHLWDFTANNIHIRTPFFLYLFPCSLKQGNRVVCVPGRGNLPAPI